MIASLYIDQTAVVRLGDICTEPSEVGRGVRQGCSLSPLLFIIYVEMMMIEAMEELDEGIKVGGNWIQDVRFAEDQGMVADTEEGLQKMMDRLVEKAEEYNMKVNVKKTKVIVINGTGRIKQGVKLNNVPLERVTRFKYLGSWITDDAKSDDDIRAKVGMAKAAFWQNKELMRRNIRFKTKLKILNTYVFSVLNYGCESWTWNAAMYKKVDAFEMWCYRRILKINWFDGVSNAEVLSRIHTKLHFREDMMRRKVRYAGHVLRGSSGLAHLQILEGPIEGKRKVGSPRWVPQGHG